MSPALLARLAAYAAEHAWSLSTATRTLIERGVREHEEPMVCSGCGRPITHGIGDKVRLRVTGRTSGGGWFHWCWGCSDVAMTALSAARREWDALGDAHPS